MNLTELNQDVRKRKNNDNYPNGKHVPTIDDSQESVTKQNNKRVITIVFISLLLDLLAFTMILPLFPSLLEYYSRAEGGGRGLYAWMVESVREFQTLLGVPERFSSVLFGGVLGSMFSFLQFLASPIMGSLSDAYGRKPTLLVCLILHLQISPFALYGSPRTLCAWVHAAHLQQAGIALSHAVWGFAHSFGLFVLARFIGGLSKANVSLSMAVITDASNDNTRARGMALVGLAFSLGFMVGPVAGAWFAAGAGAGAGAGASLAWGARPALLALALSLANLLLVGCCLPETLPQEKRSRGVFLSLSRTVDFVSPYHLLRFTAVDGLSKSQARVLSNIGLIYFLYLFFYSGLEFTLTFLTHHTFGFSAMQQGKMFLVIGAVMAALQGGAARRLGARGAAAAARAALLLTPLSFACVAQAARARPPLLAPLAWLWTGLVLFAIATAFAVSCLTSVAAGRAPERSRGAVLGCLRSLGALARAAGPLLASAVYWCSGASVTYSAGAAVLVVPALMLYRLKT